VHIHPFTEVFYFLNGKGFMHINNKKYAVKKGDLFILDPFQQHYESSSDEFPLEYIVLGVENLQFIDPVKDKSHYEDSTSFDYFFHYTSFTQNKQITDLLDNILNELNTSDDDDVSFNISAYLSMLLLIIKKETKLSFLHNQSQPYSKDVAIVKRYIDSCFCENINVEDLAQRVFVSKYYLIHQFKKEVGMSPIQYLISVRLNFAKFQLESSNYTISKIARLAGFNNSTYFSSCFKKAFGISPKEYRANIK
jgi:AraC-like DNA-binding protein